MMDVLEPPKDETAVSEDSALIIFFKPKAYESYFLNKGASSNEQTWQRQYLKLNENPINYERRKKQPFGKMPL